MGEVVSTEPITQASENSPYLPAFAVQSGNEESYFAFFDPSTGNWTSVQIAEPGRVRFNAWGGWDGTAMVFVAEFATGANPSAAEPAHVIRRWDGAWQEIPIPHEWPGKQVRDVAVGPMGLAVVVSGLATGTEFWTWDGQWHQTPIPGWHFFQKEGLGYDSDGWLLAGRDLANRIVVLEWRDGAFREKFFVAPVDGSLSSFIWVSAASQADGVIVWQNRSAMPGQTFSLLAGSTEGVPPASHITPRNLTPIAVAGSADRAWILADEVSTGTDLHLIHGGEKWKACQEFRDVEWEELGDPRLWTNDGTTYVIGRMWADVEIAGLRIDNLCQAEKQMDL